MQIQKRESFVKKLMKKTSNLRRHNHNHRPSDSTATIHFRVRKAEEDSPGEILHICGSIPELGGGSMEAAPRMELSSTDSEGRVWTFDVVVPLFELEHSRKDIASTFDGNPQGYVFTYNYVIKQTLNGHVAYEKFEEIPRRGLARSTLLAGSASADKFVHELTLEHVWNQPEIPVVGNIVPRELDMSKGADISKLPSTPAPVSASEGERLKGKSISQQFEPASSSAPPSIPARSTSTAQIGRVVNAQAERSVSFKDSTKIAPKPRTFKWYRTLTGRQIRTPVADPVDIAPMLLRGSQGEGLADLLPKQQEEGVLTRTDITSSRSSEASTPAFLSPTSVLSESSMPLSPSKRKFSAEEDSTSEKRRREEDTRVTEFESHCDQLRAADIANRPIETSPINETFTSELKVEDFEDLTPITPVYPPLEAVSSNSSNISVGGQDVSEDVLLERIGETVPLLASDSGELPDVDSRSASFYENKPIIVELEQISQQFAAPIGLPEPIVESIEPIVESIEPIIESSKAVESEPIVESRPSVDPVLFGKWHHVGLELKRNIGANQPSQWLSTLKNKIESAQVAIVDAMAATPAPIETPIIREEFSSSEPIDFTFSHRVPAEIIRMEEEERSSRMSRGVDPVLSGRWRNLGLEFCPKSSYPAFQLIKKALIDAISEIPMADPFEQVTLVGERTAEVESMPAFVAPIFVEVPAIETPAIVETPAIIETVIETPNVPVTQIENDEHKMQSVFSHNLTHRRHEVVAEEHQSPKATTVPYTIGYHQTRQDFMPIIHSTSKIAIDNVDAPVVASNETLSAPIQGKGMSMISLALLLIVGLWFFMMSAYFPESMVMTMSGSPSTELAIPAVEKPLASKTDM